MTLVIIYYAFVALFCRTRSVPTSTKASVSQVLRLWSLLQRVHVRRSPECAHARTHGRTTIQVSCVWQRVHSEKQHEITYGSAPTEGNERHIVYNALEQSHETRACLILMQECAGILASSHIIDYIRMLNTICLWTYCLVKTDIKLTVTLTTRSCKNCVRIALYIVFTALSTYQK